MAIMLNASHFPDVGTSAGAYHMDEELNATLAAPAIMGLAQLLDMIPQDEEIPVRGLAAITRLIAEAAALDEFSPPA